VTRDGFLSIDRITHRAALIGHILDQLSQLPLAGVEVVITSGPAAWTARVAALQMGRPAARPDRCVTDASGFFRYLDLPVGAYTLSAAVSGTRYGAATATATVAASGAVTVHLTLAPTAITGTVKTTAPAGTALGMVRVRFPDSGEVTYTAADGTFTLAPVEVGTNRALELSAQNHTTTTLAITPQQGKSTAAPPLTLTHT
jgi:hypothetical protein